MNARRHVLALIAALAGLALGMAEGARAQLQDSSACPADYAPVCARKDGANRTYANQCLAAADKARVLGKGRCPEICTMIYHPVCAAGDDRRWRTYGNACQAMVNGARLVHRGLCLIRLHRPRGKG